MKRSVIITVIAIIFISNLPIFKFFLQEDKTYSNADGSFTYNEEGGQGKSYWGCERRYSYFLCKNPEKDQDGDN